LLGVKVGANWEQLLQQFKRLDYVVAAALVALVVWVSSRSGETTAAGHGGRRALGP
jgi:hypothetical protein